MTQAVEAAQSGNFSKLLVVAGFHLMLLGGCVAVLVWMIAGWGAYRELTGLSKQRSMAAGVIFLLLGAVVITFLYFLNFALT